MISSPYSRLAEGESGNQSAGVAAEPHRAPEVIDAEQIPQLVDDFVQCVFLNFGRVSALNPRDVPSEFHDGPLEAIADAEVGNPVGPGIFGRRDHAAAAAVAEPRRYQNAHSRG